MAILTSREIFGLPRDQYEYRVGRNIPLLIEAMYTNDISQYQMKFLDYNV